MISWPTNERSWQQELGVGCPVAQIFSVAVRQHMNTPAQIGERNERATRADTKAALLVLVHTKTFAEYFVECTDFGTAARADIYRACSCRASALRGRPIVPYLRIDLPFALRQ